MSGTISKRIDWLDIAKGLGLVLVVIGHSQALNKSFPEGHRWVYSFHMPLFFFLTGCTLNLKSSVDLFRRALTLAVPYFFISFLMLPASLKSGKAASVQDSILGIIYGTGHTIYTVPLWFLTSTASSLAFLSIIALGIRAIPPRIENVAKFALATCVISAGLIAVSMVAYEIHPDLTWSDLQSAGLPWSLDLAGIAAGYMILGNCFLGALKAASKVSLTFLTSAAFLSGFASVLITTVYSIDVDLNFRRLGALPLSILCNMVGIAFIICSSMALSRYESIKKLIMPIGQAGIIVLWLHAGLENKVSRTVFGPVASEGSLIFIVASVCLATIVPTLADKFVIKKLRFLKAIFYPRLSFLKR